MVSIQDLLRYKDKVELKGEKDNVLMTVWVRVLGDWDLDQAYKHARTTSARKREILRDETSLDFQDEVLPTLNFSREDKIEMIQRARANQYQTEAFAKVIRGEKPTIEEIAVEPDAPTLEEQEKLDKAIAEVEEKYDQDLENYVKERVEASLGELNEMSDDDLTSTVKENVCSVIPFTAFVNELNAQKIIRGTYYDEACTKPAFKTMDEFKNIHSWIKQQLIEAIAKLEIAPHEIKN